MKTKIWVLITLAVINILLLIFIGTIVVMLCSGSCGPGDQPPGNPLYPNW